MVTERSKVDKRTPRTVSVVIPTFHRPDALQKTLAALMDIDYPSDLYEVIVVDDGADDQAREVVEEFGRETPNVRYLRQDHAGVASARNRGAEAAKGDLLVFLDDDMVVRPDHIRRHVENQARFGDAMVNGHWEFAPNLLADLERSPFGRFRIEIEDWVQDGIEKEPISGDLLRPAGVTACNLGVRAHTFARLGGFDESFPYAGCEDQDLSLRAREAGMPFIYDRSIDLLHQDRRLSLKEFGERQRRGATTHVFLAARHPAVGESSQMLRENGPLRRGEPLKVSAKKVVKRLLATPAGFAFLGSLARVLEVVAPRSRALRRVYWATLGVYIYAGIRDGLRSDRQLVQGEVPKLAS
jgi:GT2 family glycosyltransferase